MGHTTFSNALLATSIVDTLQKRGPLPLGYLAKLFGRRRLELNVDLRELEDEGIIKIEPDDDDELVLLKKTLQTGS